MTSRASRARADALGRDFNTADCIFDVQQKMVATFGRLEALYQSCAVLGNGEPVANAIAAYVDDVFDSL